MTGIFIKTTILECKDHVETYIVTFFHEDCLK